MRVYVIMGNDYPEAVLTTEKSAKKFCDKKKQEKAEKQRGALRPRIYWRYYEFELDKSEEL